MASAFSSRTLPRQVASGWLTSSVLLIGLLAAVPGAHADTIPDWNLITATTLQTAKAGTGLAHSRVYAMVHGAMFDAVNAIDRRYQSYAADLEAAPGASPRRRGRCRRTHGAHGALSATKGRRSTPRWRHRWPRFRTVRQRPMAWRSARRRQRKCSRCAATTG